MFLFEVMAKVADKCRRKEQSINGEELLKKIHELSTYSLEPREFLSKHHYLLLLS